jgi:hypothetical protein
MIPDPGETMQSIETLRQGVHQWLIDHDLHVDTAFHLRTAWEARKEPYLAGSDLVLVFEGALYRVMNGCDKDSIRLYDEFEQFVRAFGYFFELGHAWNMGFYPLPIPQDQESPAQSIVFALAVR